MKINENHLNLYLAKKNNLAVKEDKNHGIFIQDATEVYVNNVDQMKKVMKTGAENRFYSKKIVFFNK